MTRFKESHPAAIAPLILLPGTWCDERLFAPLVRHLGDREIRVLPVAGATSAHALARAILDAAPAQFVLIGFSLGGIVALEIAAQAPERVLGLGLIATNAREDQLGAERRRADLALAQDRGIAPFLLDRLWPRYVAPRALEDRALQNLILDMAETLGFGAFAEQTEIAISRADSRPRLPQLSMPVLVLCGAEDQICSPDLHREIAEAAPNATLHLVSDAGHFVLLEAPDQTAALIRVWLDGPCRAQLEPARICKELP